MSFWHFNWEPSGLDPGSSADKATEDAVISGLLGLWRPAQSRAAGSGTYPLEFTLAVCVAAMLAEVKNHAEIARHAAAMPQALLRKISTERNWFRLRYQWPGRSAVWNVLTKIGAAMMDRMTGVWLSAQARKDEEGKW